LRFAGGDPLAAIALYGNRIWHVHFKDCQPELAARSRTQKWDYFTSVRNGIFCELGQGDVDFKAVIDQLKAQEYQGWIVVEQDVLPGMGTPQQSARRNRNYLRQIGM
jgi:inosose dehydratase